MLKRDGVNHKHVVLTITSFKLLVGLGSAKAEAVGTAAFSSDKKICASLFVNIFLLLFFGFCSVGLSAADFNHATISVKITDWRI